VAKPIAIIPARGGSKRIKRKNITRLLDRPMIAWPLGVLRASGLFARIVVTTDDEEIAQVAREAGAEVPFLRAGDLSGDYTGTTEVIQDAVARLALPGDTPVACIYPTAVFLRAEDLQSGLSALERGATWAFSVGEYRTPIERAYRLADGALVPVNAAAMPKRSQDLEPAYFDAGQFYWARAATWGDPAARVWDGAAPVVLPPDRVCDIDTPEDLALATQMLRALNPGPSPT